MDVPYPRSSAQEVDSAPAELSRARARQKELEAAQFDEAVYLVKQRRHFLDFVDDNGAVLAADLLDVADIAGKAGESIGVEQVKDVCVWNCFAYILASFADRSQ